jgi:protocatechuate 3,4-dioxygenase beta subunit
MKRLPSLSVAVVLLVAGGWLVRAWLRAEPPVPDPARERAAPADGPSTTATPPKPAPVETAGRALAEPAPERKEETKSAEPKLEPTGVPGSIVGRVLSPDDEPVPDVEVELVRGPAMGLTLPALTTPTGLLVQTDANGRYRFGGVEPNDDYLVFARHQEFGDCEAGPIVVHSGQETQFADVRLRVGVMIEGTVTSNGRPVEGATVILSNAMDRIRRFNPGPLKDRLKELDLEPIELRALTDASGHYEFRAVPFDTFEITAQSEGLARLSKNSQGNFLGGSAREHRIDFELPLAEKISGRVTDESRNGIEGAKVSATSANQSFRCEVQATSDPGGRFTLDHLAPGPYFLQVEREGYSNANRAQVQSGTSDVEIEMRLQGGVLGVVADEETGVPIPEFELSVLQSHKGRGPAALKEHLRFSDSGGRFEIRNLDPGRYAIQASVPEYADGTSEEFEVVRGQATPGVRVEMNRGGSIAGVVRDRSGQPVKNALVQVRENGMKDNPVIGLLIPLARGERPNQTRTAEDGSFRIDLIVPDTYQIFVRHAKFAQLERNDVTVEKGRLKELGSLELSKGGRVSGRAFDLEGRPLKGATIVAVSKTQDYRSARSGNDGFFEITGLPAGDYTITINSYPSNPPINTLKALVYARNSAEKRQISEGDDLTVDLQLKESGKGK